MLLKIAMFIGAFLSLVLFVSTQAGLRQDHRISHSQGPRFTPGGSWWQKTMMVPHWGGEVLTTS
jgi:hypothetical protein